MGVLKRHLLDKLWHARFEIIYDQWNIHFKKFRFFEKKQTNDKLGFLNFLLFYHKI